MIYCNNVKLNSKIANLDTPGHCHDQSTRVFGSTHRVSAWSTAVNEDHQ